jgi:hypothetical protein
VKQCRDPLREGRRLEPCACAGRDRHRNRAMLMAAPRSPSLPPSFG